MKTVIRCGVLAALLLGLAGSARAEARLEEHPGFFPLELLPSDALSVEINISGPMLKLVSAAAADDPEFSALVAGLEAIRVRVAPAAELDVAGLRRDMRATVSQLEGAGWHAILRVREKDEEVYVFLRESGDRIQGLTLLALDGEEVATINIVGHLDTDRLGAIGEALELDELEDLGLERRR